MKLKELKALVESVTGVESLIDKSTDGSFYVSTNVWYLSTEQLNRIREDVTLKAVAVDGGKLQLVLSPVGITEN